MKNSIAYLFVLLALVVDLCMWGFINGPFPFFLRALFYALLGAHASLSVVGFACFVSLWHLFLVTGSMGADLLIMLPFGLAYYYLKEIADVPIPLFIVSVFLAVVLQSILIDRALFGIPFGMHEGIFSFISALCMVYLVVGSQGNRLLR